MFNEALAWGKVYGDVIPESQWDEMRDVQASNFAARLAALNSKKESSA